MPRLDVILPLSEDSQSAGAEARAALAALPPDSRLVVLAHGDAQLALEDDPRVELHRTPRTFLPHQAMNWLLEHTDSELVARADPGDMALPWRFRLALGAIARGADVAFAQALGRGTAPRGYSFSDSAGSMALGTHALRLHLLLSSRVTCGSLVARREALTAVGGYRDVALTEYDLALRLAMRPLRLQRLSAPAVVTGAPPTADGTDSPRKSDGLVADAFRALSTQLLGRTHLRLPVLAALPLTEEELDEELAAFQTDMRRAAQSLALHERIGLLRALRRRIAATRQLHRSEMASVAW